MIFLSLKLVRLLFFLCDEIVDVFEVDSEGRVSKIKSDLKIPLFGSENFHITSVQINETEKKNPHSQIFGKKDNLTSLKMLSENIQKVNFTLTQHTIALPLKERDLRIRELCNQSHRFEILCSLF
jgi:hypothetical protein